MTPTRTAAAVLLLAGLALAGCGDRPAANDTKVLGGQGTPAAEAPVMVDADGRAIPRPPVPAGTPAQVARSGDEAALAVWVQDGHVVASAYAPGTGWSPARPLEEIYGEASDPQLASNGHGAAMAVWRHTVGSIRSLRFSHFDATLGWSTPDVLPGALPQPDAQGAGEDDAPRLAMDEDGNATARWPSGFAPGEEQVARFVPGKGWSRPASEPVVSAASPAHPVR
jgi:hypothetical protein